MRQRRVHDANWGRTIGNSGPVDFYGRMPCNAPAGRYATPAEIRQIIDRLNAGLPE